MKISGRYTFPATREEVWAALNDPEVLARTIPGCQKLEQVGDHTFESTLRVGLQAVKGTYNGTVSLDDIRPPEHYKILVDGKGSNGFMKGEGSIDLHDEGDSTSIEYSGEAQVGGTIASVGQRLIEGAARTMINQSLKALAAQIEARKGGGNTPPADNGQQTAGAGPPAGAAGQTTGDAPPPEEPPVGEAVTAGASRQPAGAPAAAVQTGPQPEFMDAPAQVAGPDTPATASFQRRSIVVPEHERLSEADVARGVLSDFLSQRPWLPWVVIAFLLGIVLGQRKR